LFDWSEEECNQYCHPIEIVEDYIAPTFGAFFEEEPGFRLVEDYIYKGMAYPQGHDFILTITVPHDGQNAIMDLYFFQVEDSCPKQIADALVSLGPKIVTLVHITNVTTGERVYFDSHIAFCYKPSI
jgi:hypothetical protein